MKRLLASAYTVIATLLLTHTCTLHRSTDAAFLSKWTHDMKAFFARSIPGLKKPAPLRPLDEDLVAKFKLYKRPVAMPHVFVAMSTPLRNIRRTPKYFMYRSASGFPVPNPFVDADGSILSVKFDDTNAQNLYETYKKRAVDEAQPIYFDQARTSLPETLLSYSNTVAFTEGYFNYQCIRSNRNVVHWWVNFACTEAFDRCNKKSIQAIIQEREVPGLAAIAERIRISKHSQFANSINPRLVSDDGVTPMPITVTNFIQHVRIELGKAKIHDPERDISAAASILPVPQTGIHILALLVPQRADKKADHPYTRLQIRSMFHMALSGLIRASDKSNYISHRYNSKAVPVVHLNIEDAAQLGSNPLPVLLIYMAAARAAGVNFVAWGNGMGKVWGQALRVFNKHVWPRDQPTIRTEMVIDLIMSFGVELKDPQA